MVLMLLVKETYAPALLRQRTKRRREETRDRRWWCQWDHQETGLQIVKSNMIRPVRMIVGEPIWCVLSTFFLSAKSA